MDTAQGPNWDWVPFMNHQPARQQQDKYPGLTLCPLEGQGLVRGEVGGRQDGEQTGSSATPTGTRQAGLVYPQNQVLPFSIKKQVGVRLC